MNKLHRIVLHDLLIYISIFTIGFFDSFFSCFVFRPTTVLCNLTRNCFAEHTNNVCCDYVHTSALLHSKIRIFIFSYFGESEKRHVSSALPQHTFYFIVFTKSDSAQRSCSRRTE